VRARGNSLPVRAWPPVPFDAASWDRSASSPQLSGGNSAAGLKHRGFLAKPRTRRWTPQPSRRASGFSPLGVTYFVPIADGTFKQVDKATDVNLLLGNSLLAVGCGLCPFRSPAPVFDIAAYVRRKRIIAASAPGLARRHRLPQSSCLLILVLCLLRVFPV
jgi:hypothetical protein